MSANIEHNRSMTATEQQHEASERERVLEEQRRLEEACQPACACDSPYDWCGQHCPGCGGTNFNSAGGFSGDIRTHNGGLMGVDITRYKCGDCGDVWCD